VLQKNVQTETQVVKVGRRGVFKEDAPGAAERSRQPFRLLIRESKGKERIDEADVVLDCTGTYGQHRWLGDGGIPAAGESAAEANIVYGLDDVLGDKRSAYANKIVLVVGSGYSAASTVSNLARLAQDAPVTWVVWLARGEGTTPLKRFPGDPLRERDRLAARANNLATRADGNVEFHGQAAVEAVEYLGPDKGFRVVARIAGKPRAWDVDRVIGNVGYDPDTSLYRELQVHECYASLGPMKLAAALLGSKTQDCLKQGSHGPETLRNPEPGFFILGAKSYGRNSSFLLRIGFEQIRDVFTLITGNTGLNLHKPA